ncbi:MAG: guanylate kinase [Acidobacteriota bacterium]
MRKGILFVITAPSGAGKTTIIRKVMKSIDSLGFSVSYTTREKRRGEVGGKDYRFVNLKTFRRVRDAGGFLEWATIFGDYYGTPVREVSDALKKGMDIILDIDVQGAAQVRRKRKNAVFVFIMPPDYKTLKSRLEKRKSESREKIKTRMEAARKDVKEFSKFDYIIVNDDLKDAVRTLKGIILAERARMKMCRQAARKIAATFP